MIKVREQHGQKPSTRFGHTTTLVNDHTIILFGGATGDAGRYIITGDTHALDLRTTTWKKVETEGVVPAARAAHAACAVDLNQLVIYGGATGGGTLSPEELMLMDYREDGTSAWLEVPVRGITPGRRYGHSMVYHKPLIIVYGGNIGNTCTDHIYFLDVDTTPFSWEKVTLAPNTPRPPARIYHTADVCREGPASGMMVVFGGRTVDNSHLRDAWGLRQHRDGRWDWVEAPVRKGEPPVARCQHSATFIGSRLVISGGRGDDVNAPLSTSVYSTTTCEWTTLPSVRRFRHATWAADKKLFIVGGFEHSNAAAPTDTLQVLDIDEALSNPQAAAQAAELAARGVPAQQQPRALNTPISNVNGANRPGAMPIATAPPPVAYGDSPGGQVQPNAGYAAQVRPPPTNQAAYASAGQPGIQPQSGPYSRDPTPVLGQYGEAPPHQYQLKMSNVVEVSKLDPHAMTNKVLQMQINELTDEGRKLRVDQGPSLAIARDEKDPLVERFLMALQHPGNHRGDMMPWGSPDSFALSWQDVSMLCDRVLELMKKEPSLLRLRSAIKIYGDIHGQFADLMQMFDEYLGPWEGPKGDIGVCDYLFLGDYVDRGSFSLETICYLFALKLKYPGQVHLLRGNHEDSNINSAYGFQTECSRRLGEDVREPDSCWAKFNVIFEYMPLGAVIDDKILCIHGGIGGTINSLEDIACIERPLRVEQQPTNEAEQKVTDLLWSDPTDHDGELGVVNNNTRDPDGSGRIAKFGPDRVDSFLAANRLELIIRAHECVMDGFERFASGKLITLFSATDYCGHHKNAGALLFIRRDQTIIPRIIYPEDRAVAQWDQQLLETRPPTPPRPAIRAHYER